LDDPLSAGAFLREQVLTWYRSSADTPDWVDHMTPRWSGLFAESRATGGRIQSWLNLRLSAVHEAAAQGGKLGTRIRQGLRRSGSADAAVARTTMQQIQAEAAQALLDDLAARPRTGDAPFPLVRLSELAVRRQVQTINDALSVLFNSHETGPFIVLHPNRYPDCDEVQIRPPTGAATGAALAFVMVTSKPGRRPGGHAAVGAEAGSTSEGGEDAYDGTTIWEGSSITAKTWPSLVDSYRQEKKRLEAPPKDYRNRPAYAALRDVLLDDAEFRKSFLSVKWRGRPAGLPLLVNLLTKGTLTPEVATDFEYLEAELGALAADDPAWRPEGGTWKFRGWTVTREGDAKEGVRYKSEREAPSTAPPP
ncbi:MAG TPA: hypothetical protein VGS18_04830, partial [Thermoplasmata archaeon]|nr:hypothetical protein [Thermoplasmata archaeon]